MAKRLLFVIAAKDFRDEEFLIPAKIVERAGVEIVVASTKRGVCQGAGGAKVESSRTVKEVRAAGFDGIVFIGGPGMAELVDSLSFQKLAKEFFEEKKLVAAICVAPVILAKAGVLKGVSATVWQGSVSELAQAGAVYLTKPVVVAGRIITANGPAAAKEFGRAIVNFLKEN